MSEFFMSIDGQAVAAKETFGVVNPASGEVFEQAPECTRDQLDAAFESAQRAYVSWRSDETVARRCSLSPTC